MIIVDFVTDAKAASALLPKQMTTYPIPEMPGKALMKLLFADYHKVSKLGPYKEAVVQIAALHDGELSLYIPFIYVTTDSAVAAGQEIGGYPKKIASIVMQRYGNDFEAYLERGGKRIISLNSRRGLPLLSTPLPADKPVLLPFPLQHDVALAATDWKAPGIHTAAHDLTADYSGIWGNESEASVKQPNGRLLGCPTGIPAKSCG